MNVSTLWRAGQLWYRRHWLNSPIHLVDEVIAGACLYPGISLILTLGILNIQLKYLRIYLNSNAQNVGCILQLERQRMMDGLKLWRCENLPGYCLTLSSKTWRNTVYLSFHCKAVSNDKMIWIFLERNSFPIKNKVTSFLKNWEE